MAKDKIDAIGQQAHKLLGNQEQMMSLTTGAKTALNNLQTLLASQLAPLALQAYLPPPNNDKAFPPLPNLLQRMSPPPEVVASLQAADCNLIFDLSAIAVAQAKTMTETQLVERANVAADQVESKLLAQCPGKQIFASAKMLEQGGIQYLTTSAEAAEWVQRPDIKAAFLAAFFEGKGTLTKCTHLVITEFAPISFKPECNKDMRALELANGMAPNNIAKCHWLKKPDARGPNQTRAHLEITFANKTVANNAIQSGLMMDGQVLHTQKKLSKPKKCT
jgi:hypothetical protein